MAGFKSRCRKCQFLKSVKNKEMIKFGRIGAYDGLLIIINCRDLSNRPRHKKNIVELRLKSAKFGYNDLELIRQILAQKAPAKDNEL